MYYRAREKKREIRAQAKEPHAHYPDFFNARRIYATDSVPRARAPALRGDDGARICGATGKFCDMRASVIITNSAPGSAVVLRLFDDASRRASRRRAIQLTFAGICIYMRPVSPRN